MLSKKEVLKDFTKSDNANELNSYYLEFVNTLIKYFIQEIDKIKSISDPIKRSDKAQELYLLHYDFQENNSDSFLDPRI